MTDANGDTRRARFCFSAFRYLGAPVLWGDLDCSDLVARCELAIGLPDRRATWRAQTYADNYVEAVGEPLPGDLAFFGNDWQHVAHVAIALARGHVISADGASSYVRTPEQAAAKEAQVNIHRSTGWRSDFLGWRRHPHLDAPGPDGAHNQEPQHG